MQAWEIETRKGVSLFVGIPYIPTFRYTHCVVEDSWRNAWQPPNTIWRKNFAFGVATAREQLAEEFLASGYTHFLHLDCDIVLRQDTIARMLELDADVVVARYHDKSPLRLPQAFRHSQVPFRRDGPIDFKTNEIFEFPRPDGDVLLSGLGCVLVKREVFEKLKRPFYLFSSEYENLDDYDRVSEDFFFLLKVQNEAKAKVIYAPSISVGHVGEVIVWDKDNIQFI